MKSIVQTLWNQLVSSRKWQALVAAAMIGWGLLAVPMTALSAEEVGDIRGLDLPTRIPEQYIVTLKPDVVAHMQGLRHEPNAEGAVGALAASLTGQYGGQVGFEYGHALLGFSVSAIGDEDILAMSADPAVDYVTADHEMSLDTTRSPVTWGLDRIDQRYLPLNNSYTYPTGAGYGVNVYVVDSGIRTSHIQFVARKAGMIGPGFTAILDGYGTDDCNGHGTHVAGTIGGLNYGVANLANIHPIRVFGCTGTSPASTVASGLNWVLANASYPAVVNMSLGGALTIADPVDVAVGNLLAAGITVVAAAGNASRDACTVSPAYLGGSTDVITVANATDSDSRHYSSNWGPCVSLFAPGTDIVSAGIASDTATAAMTGTSMAAPHVSGAAALYLSDYPSASPATVKNAILYASTANVISNTGVSPNRLLYIGFGSSGGTPTTTGSVPGAPTGLVVNCYGNNLYGISWTAASGDVGGYEVYYKVGTTDVYDGTTGLTDWLTPSPSSSPSQWRVRACNGAGCGSFSAYVTLHPTPTCP